MTPDRRDGAAMDRLPGEDEIARVYRNAAHDAPAPALDAKILAAAEAAARPHRGAWARRWVGPLSVAATIVLTVGLVLRQGIFDPATPLPVADQPPAEGMMQDRVPEESKAPARAKRDAILKQAAPRAPAPAAAEVPTEAQREVAAEAPTAALSARSAAKPDAAGAHIEAVTVAGEPGAYRFTVSIRSAAQGCRQYADWWEVVDLDGRLLYRHVLTASHVHAQSFVSEGGPIPTQPDTHVWVRAHVNTSGYGGTAFKGSPRTGFAAAAPAADFADTLATQPPLPPVCIE